MTFVESLRIKSSALRNLLTHFKLNIPTEYVENSLDDPGVFISGTLKRLLTSRSLNMRTLVLVCLYAVFSLAPARPTVEPTDVLVSFDLKSVCFGYFKCFNKFTLSKHRRDNFSVFSLSLKVTKSLENLRT